MSEWVFGVGMYDCIGERTFGRDAGWRVYRADEISDGERMRGHVGE